MNGFTFAPRDQTHVRQHGGMSLASLDIKRGEAMVKTDRFAKTQHQLGGARRETPTPTDL
jgi:hypothetical protein